MSENLAPDTANHLPRDARKTRGLSKNVRSVRVGCTSVEDTPFGDHLGPNTQLTAFKGHPPSKSLREFCERAKLL